LLLVYSHHFHSITLATLPAIDLPSICFNHLHVFADDNPSMYVKSICYVNIKATHYQAKKICQREKMELYKPDSNDAKQKIGQLGFFALGSSPKAVVFVDGRQGNKCLTYNGQGIPKYDWCKTSYHFMCELNELGNF
jgi:hypothetical protein